MERRLTTAAFFSLVYTILVLALYVHWVRFVGRFLILCIVSHLASPHCLLSVYPYMDILCNSFDKGGHSVLYSSCTLLPRLRRGSCTPGTIYEHVHVCAYVLMYVYKCTFICIYVHVYVCTNVCIYVHVCKYACIYVCKCMYIHTFIHSYMQTYMYIL